MCAFACQSRALMLCVEWGTTGRRMHAPSWQMCTVLRRRSRSRFSHTLPLPPPLATTHDDAKMRMGFFYFLFFPPLSSRSRRLSPVARCFARAPKTTRTRHKGGGCAANERSHTSPPYTPTTRLCHRRKISLSLSLSLPLTVGVWVELCAFLNVRRGRKGGACRVLSL